MRELQSLVREDHTVRDLCLAGESRARLIQPGTNVRTSVEQTAKVLTKQCPA